MKILVIPLSAPENAFEAEERFYKRALHLENFRSMFVVIPVNDNNESSSSSITPN
jgi:hypothetical protein